MKHKSVLTRFRVKSVQGVSSSWVEFNIQWDLGTRKKRQMQLCASVYFVFRFAISADKLIEFSKVQQQKVSELCRQAKVGGH